MNRHERRAHAARKRNRASAWNAGAWGETHLDGGYDEAVQRAGGEENVTTVIAKLGSATLKAAVPISWHARSASYGVEEGPWPSPPSSPRPGTRSSRPPTSSRWRRRATAVLASAAAVRAVIGISHVSTPAACQGHAEAPCHEFTAHYVREVLGRLDAQQTIDELLEMADGKTPALLCFEHTHGPAWCHRSLVSAWLHQTLGLEVPELGREADGCGVNHPKLCEEARVVLTRLGG
jgi:uncharacterized protein DUF488